MSTKVNGNGDAINKKTGHDKIQQFLGHNFAIIPHMLKGPTKGHYIGKDTEADLLDGYATHSHGKITKVVGPYGYFDGTDDYYYDFVIKLRDSKASALLQKHGPTLWTPFSVSPHIMPLSGPDWDMDDWRPVGVALVDRGAFGPQSIVSKFCTGSSAECEKSIGSAQMDRTLNRIGIVPCDKSDNESTEILSSIVSKVASLNNTMSENIPNAVSNAPPIAELKPEPQITNVQPAVNQISITAEEIQKIKDEATAKSEAIWKEKVTALETKDKINTLNIVFAKVKDPAVKEALIKKYQGENVDLVKQAMDDFVQHLSKEEEEEAKKEDKTAEEPNTQAKKSKASSLKKEPDVPAEEEAERKSKASSQETNAAQLIQRMIMGGR